MVDRQQWIFGNILAAGFVWSQLNYDELMWLNDLYYSGQLDDQLAMAYEQANVDQLLVPGQYINQDYYLEPPAPAPVAPVQNQAVCPIVCLVLFIIVGGVLVGSGTINIYDPGVIAVGVVLFILIIACIAGTQAQAAKRRAAEAAAAYNEPYVPQVQPQPVYYQPQPQPQAPQIVEKEKVVEKVIVKVKCPLCGSLNDDTNAFCSNCGAKLA
jgi:hypothetical protein